MVVGDVHVEDFAIVALFSEVVTIRISVEFLALDEVLTELVVLSSRDAIATN